MSPSPPGIVGKYRKIRNILPDFVANGGVLVFAHLPTFSSKYYPPTNMDFILEGLGLPWTCGQNYEPGPVWYNPTLPKEWHHAYDSTGVMIKGANLSQRLYVLVVKPL